MTLTSIPTRVAVLGCGYWGMNYVRVFNELPEAHVSIVCDERTQRLGDIARRMPWVNRTGSIDDVLNSNVDAVAICTEATAHYEHVRRCLAAGKHVLVEKPITTSVLDAEQLIAEAEARARVLLVGHTFIYNAGVRKVKELLNSGEGIYYLYARRTNLGPIRHDVNALWDLATHDIAIFNYLLGMVPDWVNAIGAKVLRNCREDVGFIALGYPGGVLGHIHVSWADPNKAREVVVVCRDRRIVFNDLNGMEQVRIFEKGVCPEPEPATFGEYKLLIRDGDILSPKVEITEPLKEQCRHFLECVRSGGRPLTGGREGADVLRVLRAADESILNHGIQVEVSKNGHVITEERVATGSAG